MKNHMEKDLDLRVTKTYQSLFRAFAALLSEKKLEDITVNELCELAMIRRATFYKHFSDKFDFFTFFLKELQHSSMMRAAQTADPNDPCTFYISAIRSAFDFMEENACHLARALESGGILNLLMVLDQDELTSSLEHHLTERKKAGQPLPASPEILAQLFSGALFQVSRWWYTHRDVVDKEEVIAELSSLVRSFCSLCSHDS
ncbi:hypothetical protein B5F37_02090 [Drancourtella sp. An210]|nr:hypothetical protein B5F37_02090 [Drancourtella sp. An210]